MSPPTFSRLSTRRTLSAETSATRASSEMVAIGGLSRSLGNLLGPDAGNPTCLTQLLLRVAGSFGFGSGVIHPFERRDGFKLLASRLVDGALLSAFFHV